jgi:hypothetical protein
LQVTSSLSGQCSSLTTYSTTVATPTGYTISFTAFTATLSLTLSSNSQTITVVNSANSACSGSYTKSGDIKQHANSVMLFALVLLNLVMSVSKM